MMNGTVSPSPYSSHSLVEGGAACRSGMAVLSAKVEVEAAGECGDKKSPTASSAEEVTPVLSLGV